MLKVFSISFFIIVLTSCAPEIKCRPDILINGPFKNQQGEINIDMEHLQPGIKCKF